MSPIAGVEPRLLEIGRIRMGIQDKGHPEKLEHWRLTSSHMDSLHAAATIYGGEVTGWDRGGYQLLTTSASLNVIVPPNALTQYLEAWTAGGIQRRCDGRTELVTGEPCICDAEDERACEPSTILRVLMPELPGLGCWVLTTKGWNAAQELQGSVALLERLPVTAGWPVAELVLDQRTKAVGGQTRRFAVPILRLPYTLAEAGLTQPTQRALVVDTSTGEIVSPAPREDGEPPADGTGAGETPMPTPTHPGVEHETGPGSGTPEAPSTDPGPSPHDASEERAPASGKGGQARSSGERKNVKRWRRPRATCQHANGTEVYKGEEVCRDCGKPYAAIMAASA